MTGEPRRRGAAFFDLDRTIISGSSVFALGWAAYRAGMVTNRELMADATNAVSFLFAGASDEKTDAVKNRVLQAIEGVTVEKMAGLGEQIIPRLESEVRREARGLIDLHHAADRDTYIVSASPIEIVDDFAAAIGLTGGIGTVAAVEDGVYNGELAEPFCYGEGKAIAIRKLVEEKGYDLRLSYAYTDSAGDLPMLEIVGHPVAVNPDRALETIAYHRGWAIVEFSRARKKVMKRTTAAVGAAGFAGAAFAVGLSAGRRSAARQGLVRRVLG
ncbi:MAG: HAD family hydrolase [Acidimicrobiia bacterium]